MAQFIRENIDIISSRSRPTTGNSGYTESTLEDTFITDTIKTNNEVPSTLSASLFNNYTFVPKELRKDAKLPERSTSSLGENPTTSLTYESALETMQPHKSVGDMKNAADSQHTYSSLSFQTPEEVPVSYRNNWSFAAACSGVGERIWDLIRFMFTGASERIHDPERQPLIRVPQEEQSPPAAAPDGNYFSFTDNRTLFWIATVVLFIILGAIVVYTGDTLLLIKILKGMLCYLLGPGVLEDVFGRNFCTNLTDS